MHENTPALNLTHQAPVNETTSAEPAGLTKDSQGSFTRHIGLSFLLVGCLFFSACAKKTPMPEVLPPPVGFESPAFFVGNLAPSGQNLKSWSDMASTLRKSLLYVKSKPSGAVAVHGPNLTLTYGDLTRTLNRLRELLPRLDAEPGLLLQYFQWIEVNGGIDYSGYYEPTVKASRVRKPGYTQAVYYCPPELKGANGKRRYYDRKTIEEKQILAGRGLELAWAADPVDSFFLEIQGSGRLLFEDGTWVVVNYDCQNGHKYKSSGKIMREKGLLERGDIYEQREWFKKNPDRVREILNDNPSYVFFRLGDRGPVGAIGQEIAPWLSLATSRDVIPLGAVVAYGVNMPDERHGRFPLRGIGFAQDVGGAIKGRRIDIFCGSDTRANYVASHLDSKGPAWILVAR
ncbi:MAG: MltA domain-containing protein [Desulfovibrio sp.]|jgi:membrane-bound lytic murein transglycosylase A|nr:MltA domain-containing protein [Desulfovibrio sp.]